MANSHGKTIIEICKTYNLKILNGRTDGDPGGNFTYYDASLGASAVDYSICNQSFYKHINNFMTLPQNELSDHCKIVTEINGLFEDEGTTHDSYAWNKLNSKYVWDDNFKAEFIKFFDGANIQINEINQRIEAGLIESTGILIRELFQNACDFASHRINKPAKKSKSERKRTSKLWFDSDCRKLKGEVRSIGKRKRNAPSNSFLREIYCNKMKEFKKECTSKRHYFWVNKFATLEKSLGDPKLFWENWKKCSETPSTRNRAKLMGYNGITTSLNYIRIPTMEKYQIQKYLASMDLRH